jgi:peroxiredoxin
VLDKYRDSNFQVLGISIENATDAKRFRDEVSIAYPLYDGNKTGLSIMLKMGNATGALPYSVLFDRAGKVIIAKTGEFSLQELDDLIKNNL